MKNSLNIFTVLLLSNLLLMACGLKSVETPNETNELIEVIEDKIEEIVEKEPEPIIKYNFIPKAEWSALKDSIQDTDKLDIIVAVNRTDLAHVGNLDSIIIPQPLDLDFNAYLPFPEQVDLLREVDKIIIFSNPLQVFAAYENGKLMLQGQTNTGVKNSPTPDRLYFTNWKAKRSVSTVNGSWILNWNFNISNFGGIGFHQYGLPGRPASHSCLRLTEANAFYLYNWADQWILNKKEHLVANGTPVIVHGQYDYESEKPWVKLADNPLALTLNQDSMKAIITPHLEAIMQKQKERKDYLARQNLTL